LEVIEPGQRFAKVCGRTARTACEGAIAGFRKEGLPIPRTTLAIANAIHIAFPEDVKMVGVGETVKKIGTLSPVLIALNEAADLGVSARLRRARGCRQSQFVPLLMLEDLAMADLEKRKDEFIEKHNGDKKAEAIVETLIHDFLLLSQERESFPPEEHEDWVELDSGIFIAACIALTIPEALAEAGINFPGEPCETVEELEEKYSLFITTNSFDKQAGCLKGMNDAQARLLALHCAEMVLKLKDDRGGEEVDKLLGLPTFCTYADSQVGGKTREKVFREEEKRYLAVAENGGLPTGVLQLTKIVCHRTSVHKASRALNETKVLEDSWQVGSIFKGKFNTVKRHELRGSSLLNELFR
jgi:hypothetical protein